MLQNRLPEIEVPEDNPFANDILDREPCVNTFLSLIKMYSTTGCVIALDGEWGTGKTTFVKMLMQKLNRGGHPLYFNAWENDYVSDPLIALLAELKNLSPNSKKWDNVVASGGKIITSIATSAIKSVVKNKLGIDSDVVTSGIDEAGKILKHDIDNYSKQKSTFEEFRKALQEYVVDNTTEEFPVVFFIDELDRCNPQFAVHVLERIKHLFDIPNVIFVLSVNKNQLGYAIQGYYGSANIDSNNYLRRFIDIEYSLPQPKGDKFIQYLYDTYKFHEVFNNKARNQHQAFSSDSHKFKKMASFLVSSSNIDLRTTDKIFAHSRLALMSFGNNNYIIPDIFFLLCYLKITKTQLYRNIINEKFTAQELLNELESCLPLELLVKTEYSQTWRQMTYTIASFVFMYSLDDNSHERERIVNSNDSKTNSLHATYLDSETFNEAISWSYNNRFNGEIPLKYITKKIELEQGIIMI